MRRSPTVTVIMLASVLALVLTLAPARSIGSPGLPVGGVRSTIAKDGQDDSGGDPKDDTSGSGKDDGSGGSGSDAGNNLSDDSGSDDTGDDSGSGTDDSGSDDDSGHGSDNSGSGSGSHGNDDYALSDAGDDADGNLAPVVDGDGNDATDGFRALQAIVRLQPGSSIDDFNARHGTAMVAAIPSRDLYLLALPADRPEIEAEREIALDADIRWTELNFVTQAPEGRPGYFFVSGAPASAPAEPYAPALLGYADAQACGAGEGVTVAVLDTGVDAAHPLLAGKVSAGWNALNNSSVVDDAGNGRDDDGDGLVDEMVGHGTHVAGIVAGVAPKAAILPVKVLSSDGAGDAFVVAAGIYYAVDHGADVINMSLGSTYDARVIAEAIAEASEAGVLVVAAAGNAGTDRPLEFPAANAGVLSVAATDRDDLKTGFSNFGDQVDLAAPGVEISSALPGGAYGAWSGTSMAAPFVAGTAALVAQAHPSWSSPQIAKRLLRTADNLDALNPDFAGALGAGRLDSAAAVGCEPADAA